MGGTSAGRVTNTDTGNSGIDGDTLGAAGGDQRTQSYTRTFSGATSTDGLHGHKLRIEGQRHEQRRHRHPGAACSCVRTMRLTMVPTRESRSTRSAARSAATATTTTPSAASPYTNVWKPALRIADFSLSVRDLFPPDRFRRFLRRSAARKFSISALSTDHEHRAGQGRRPGKTWTSNRGVEYEARRTKSCVRAMP